MSTRISINQVISDCKAMNMQMAGKPIQSELKKVTSLIGMSYLNYIYQNDIKNEHFCLSMLLMHSQVPTNTDNPYVHLFDLSMATKTIPILEDIQLAFDYSIARTQLAEENVNLSVQKIQRALGIL